MIRLGDIGERLRADAKAADKLHERSREMLVSAVRAGARAGMTQRDIAAATGRSQPEVSRLLRFRGTTDLGRRLARNRGKVRDLAATYRAGNVRVFGSVARGTNSAQSDIDLLVDWPEGLGLFALSRLESELANLLGATVDVVPRGSLRGHLADRVLDEAVPL